MRKLLLTILLLSAALALGGCRVRVLAPPPEDARQAEETEQSDEAPMTPAGGPALPEPASDPEEKVPDAGAERREYAPDASGELAPDAEDALYVIADAPEESRAEEGDAPINVAAETAELTATETVPADEADKRGVDESGAVAESALDYYVTLLDSRLGGLFECKRLYVYWETEEDRRTVHKSSREHQMILDAGAYDVSAKLLEENLTVDDGWVSRKNPDAVVKVMDGGALDAGAARVLCGELAARSGWEGVGAVRDRRVLVLSKRLLDTRAGRAAAEVYLAKLLYPDQMADVDADEALRALTREESGGAYSGLYAYTM